MFSIHKEKLINKTRKIAFFIAFSFICFLIFLFVFSLSSSDIQEFEIIAEKNDWREAEEPEFKIEKNIKGLNTEIVLVNPKGRILELEEGKGFRLESSSPTKIKLSKLQDFKPGDYKLKINFEENNKIFNLEKEFSWGVLTVNVNKSVYSLSDKQAYIQIGVLNNEGHTICNADLEMTIISPDKTEKNLSTFNNTIQYSGECAGDSYVEVPDYFVYYDLPGKVGEYEIKLTAYTKNGKKTVTDSFKVKEYVLFDAERIGPTRIYPPEDYEMKFIIKANEDFAGEVVETTPSSFKILSPKFKILNPGGEQVFYGAGKLQIRNSDNQNEKNIVWEVDLKKGQILELSYAFNAPNISPYIYVLGPLQFISHNFMSDDESRSSLSQLLFKEQRQWQIAADSPGPSFESGEITINDSLEWTTIILDDSYTTPPVILATPVTHENCGASCSGNSAGDGGRYPVPVVRNVATTSFDISMCVNDGNVNCATGVSAETLHWFAFDVDDAVNHDWIEAGTTTVATDGSNTSETYSTSFANTPDVWTQAQTYSQNGEIGAIAWVNPKSTTGFTHIGCVYTSAAGNDNCDSGKPSETFGYVAIDAANASFSSVVNFQSGFSSPANSEWVTASFSPSYTNSRVMVTQNSDNGGQDPQYAWARNVTGAGMDFRYCEQDGGTVCDTHVAEDVYWFAVEQDINLAPDAPTLYNIPFNNEKTGTSTPDFEFTASDPDGTAGITYQVQISTDNTFTTTTVDCASDSVCATGSGTFINTEDGNDSDPFTESERIRFTSGVALTNNTTYWWRVRAKDAFSEEGSGNYGNWTATRSFTIVTGTDPSEWFQTTDEQFNTGTLIGTKTTGSDSVELTDWYDLSWQYRKKITIAGQSDAGTGYQVLLKIGESSGSSGDDFHLEGNSQIFPSGRDSGGDLRFTAGDGLTLESFWVEKVEGASPNRTAWAWVKVSADLDTNQDIYIYYGNSGATSTSSGEDAFIFFDDFETWSGWNAYSSGNVYHSNDQAYSGTYSLKKDDNNDPHGGYKDLGAFVTRNYILEGWIYRPDPWKSGAADRLAISDSNANGYGFFWSDNTLAIERRTSGSASTITSKSSALRPTNEWYKFKFEAFSNNTFKITMYNENGNEIDSLTSASDSNHSGSFTRVYVHGGHEYYLDDIYLRKFVNPEPSFNLAGEEEDTAEGIIVSPEIDFDWVQDAVGWDKASWTSDETNGFIKMQVYHTSTTTCDTLIPNSDLDGNEAGFASSPIDVSGLSTTTYGHICLKAALTNDNGTPYLNNWNVTWTKIIIEAPVVATDQAIEITATSANLQGILTDMGGADSVNVWFRWDTDDTLADPNTTTPETKSATTTFNVSITSLVPGTTYYFQAVAENSAGTATGTIESFITLPPAPGTPTYTNVSTSTLTINWTSATGTDYYHIERAVSTNGEPASGNYSEIATTTNLFYNDSGLTPNTEYWYRVRAANESGTGDYSSASGQLLYPIPPAEAPTYGDVTVSSIELFWLAPASGADYYSVERSTTTENFAEVATTTATTTTDTDLQSETQYYYQIKSVNQTGSSSASSYSSTTTLAITVSSAATEEATDISATSARIRGEITDDGNATSEARFRWKKTADSSWATTTWQNNLNTNDTYYYDLTGLDSETEYEFQTQAKNAAGEGDWSASRTFETLQEIAVILGKGRDAYQLEIDGTEIVSYINGTSIVSGQARTGWNHVILAYDKNAGEIKLYINDTEVDSAVFSESIAVNNDPLKIGDSFLGKIDEAKVFNRALSAKEVSQNYDSSGRMVIIDPSFETVTFVSEEIDVPFYPSNVNDLVLHFDADDSASIAKDAENKISQWADLSGENNHISQANGTHQPLYEENVIGSMPAVRFNGNQWLRNNVVYSQPGHVFIVFKQDGGAVEKNLEVLFDGREGEPASNLMFLELWNSSSAWRAYVSDSFGFSDPGSAANDFGVLTVLYNSNNSVARFNSINLGTDGDVGAGELRILTLGADRNDGRQFNGYVAEMLLYNRSLSSQEQEQVEQYLGEKWLGW